MPSVAAYARMLKALLPPSKIWKLDADGVLSAVALGSADELVRVDGRVRDLLEEADPRTTLELLPDFERVLGLVSEGSLDERRARVVAQLLRRQRFRPVDFQEALAPLLGQDAADVVVIETSRAQAIAVGDDREIYRFHIHRDPGLPGSYDLASAQDIVDRMKPSHTLGRVNESIDMLCDDAFSLCDRDILGA
jgi:uncharacterized protein YmfQ (DUF2313 family)